MKQAARMIMQNRMAQRRDNVLFQNEKKISGCQRMLT